jgi:hypothetical protein
VLVTYAVTFEFESRPPLTHRSTVEGRAAATCCFRATRIAQKALRPVGWTSVVCVLLERVQDEKHDRTTAEPEPAKSDSTES